MYQWPSNWKEETLRAAGIPVTQHALDVLTAWFKSTPTQAWTNNPLGLPAGVDGAPNALSTRFAAFPTHEHFRQAFKKLAHATPGKVLIHVLMDDGEHAAAWRAINALRLPGNETESDYPAALLDMVEAKYRDKLQTVKPGDRKSMGPGIGGHQGHEALMRSAQALGAASQTARMVSQHINSTLKGYGQYGR